MQRVGGVIAATDAHRRRVERAARVIGDEYEHLVEALCSTNRGTDIAQRFDGRAAGRRRDERLECRERAFHRKEWSDRRRLEDSGDRWCHEHRIEDGP
jgi:hypothetical protein